MGYRSDNRNSGFRDRPSRSGGFNRGGFGGKPSFGGRSGGFRDRDSSFKREMHEVTCAKCGKQCEVPFKPTGDKPVYCSSCFKTEGEGNSFRDNLRSNSGSTNSSGSSSSGISQEQFKELNTKLDRVLEILEMIDFEDAEEGEEESDEDADEAEQVA